MTLFLDANASAKVLPAAKKALMHCLEVPGNPSSPHTIGRKKRILLDVAREQVATALGCADKEVIFNSGATEGLRFITEAFAALARTFSQAVQGPQKGFRIWTSPLEHPAVRKNLARIAASDNIDLVIGDVSPAGQVSFAGVETADAVLCTRAHNETGILLDVDSLCAQVKDECIVCIDASQAVARLPILPKRVDAAICSAHKLGGVSGCGALFLRGRAKALNAGWTGGGQEHQLRPGTEAVALIVAMGAACAEIDSTRKRSAELTEFRDALETFVVEQDPLFEENGKRYGLFIVGKTQPRLPQTSAIAFCGVGSEALRMWADRCGLAVGFGSACSALAPHASDALLSLGLDEKVARSTLRISLDLDADAALISQAKIQLAELISKMKSRRR